MYPSPLSLLLASPPASAAEPPTGFDPAEVPALQRRQLDVQQGAMTVLLGWSALNIAGGAVGAAVADTPRSRTFWLGTAGWNVVNLAIAGTALATLPGKRRAELDVGGLRRQTDTFERAILLNVGLDVAYLAGSAWMGERGQRTADDRLKGLAVAVAIQGGFLLAFDSTTYVASTRTTAPLRR